ncbi:hypothetical protein DUI87_27838 [Hirundo rustica rustica]|uniref:COMM domain-containing protein n=1 Tax=Hirundo rustica rustica TaxID=333673 RepID=A0A3M0J4I4_HIRRU|nr:hypothetical protein DUI87_27838 [Hirundo rustica rustica]
MGLLNFTREPVPEAVSGDMHNLNQLSAQQFSALTEVLFRFLTEPKEVERFLTQLSDFATMNKISLGPLKNIVKSILLVPNGALKRNLSSEQVRADFIALGLSEEKASYFAEQWKVNSPTLTRLAVGQTLMINQLIDMEWKFGVTAGSSELEKVGSIFLQAASRGGSVVLRTGTRPHTRCRFSSDATWVGESPAATLRGNPSLRKDEDTDLQLGRDVERLAQAAIPRDTGIFLCLRPTSSARQ